MRIFCVADNIISPLGTSTQDNLEAIAKGISGVSKIADKSISDHSFYGAKILFEQDKIEGYSYLEALFIESIKSVIKETNIDLNKTILVLSSTKGNIDLLEKGENIDQVRLSSLANKMNGYFGFLDRPLLVSNACISGVSALLVAKKIIESGKYDHAIVSGGDLLTRFTLSGFDCLKAVSSKPCRPYDESRDGINLGEGVGTMILSNDPNLINDRDSFAEIVGGGQSNDANHISGPSRTGAGLKLAISKAIDEAEVSINDIDYINAHGTATLFNDEMESIAFDDLGMANIPMNSLKGYFGHTLGAAGLIESILAVRQMNKNEVFASRGFKTQGTSRSLNIVDSNQKIKVNHSIKTVSGFGGCNAAIIFRKS